MTKWRKNSEGVNFLSVSDVHLGHLHTSTEEILDHLEAIVFDGRISELDLFIIAGDLFERLLEYNHPAGGRILLFVHQLLDECTKYNCKLRVLEGTPSHDHKQNKIFDDVYATGIYSCDMKYVDTLSIEYIADWDVRVLYVPDKIRTTVQEVWDDTVKLLEEACIEQVDFAIVHGAYRHQLPPMAKEVYVTEDWLKIVKHWILVGHVHFHSVYERIAAGGSFDRLNHGEENAKGLLMGTMNFHGDVSKDKLYFIENTLAKKYVTIDCSDCNSVDESLVKIETIARKLPDYSYIKVRANKGNAVFTNWDIIKRMGLTITWTKDEKLDEEETREEAIKEEGLEDWVPLHIDRANIEDIITKRTDVLIDGSEKYVGFTDEFKQIVRGIIRESV